MIDDRLRIAGHLIRRAHQAHDSIFAEQTAGYDVTSPQMAALSAIQWNPGIDLSSLAEYIGYDAATIGSLVNRLVAKRLVSRRVGKHDRRTRNLTLTPRGEAFVNLVLRQANRVESELLAVLSPQERRHFMDLLYRVVEAAGTRAGKVFESSEIA
jgi:MarR family transcriptional regulator, temperature-dependent positive regulator of motility